MSKVRTFIDVGEGNCNGLIKEGTQQHFIEELLGSPFWVEVCTPKELKYINNPPNNVARIDLVKVGDTYFNYSRGSWETLSNIECIDEAFLRGYRWIQKSETQPKKHWFVCVVEGSGNYGLCREIPPHWYAQYVKSDSWVELKTVEDREYINSKPEGTRLCIPKAGDWVLMYDSRVWKETYTDYDKGNLYLKGYRWVQIKPKEEQWFVGVRSARAHNGTLIKGNYMETKYWVKLKDPSEIDYVKNKPEGATRFGVPKKGDYFFSVVGDGWIKATRDFVDDKHGLDIMKGNRWIKDSPKSKYPLDEATTLYHRSLADEKSLTLHEVSKLIKLQNESIIELQLEKK